MIHALFRGGGGLLQRRFCWKLSILAIDDSASEAHQNLSNENVSIRAPSTVAASAGALVLRDPGTSTITNSTQDEANESALVVRGTINTDLSARNTDNESALVVRNPSNSNIPLSAANEANQGALVVSDPSNTEHPSGDQQIPARDDITITSGYEQHPVTPQTRKRGRKNKTASETPQTDQARRPQTRSASTPQAPQDSSPQIRRSTRRSARKRKAVKK